MDEHPRTGGGAVRPRPGNASRVVRNTPPPPPPAISQTDQNSWQVHVPEATMFISQTAGSPPAITAINYANADFVPQDVKNRLAFARRIVGDTAMSTALKITPDQLTQLKKYTPRLHMVTESADDDQLKSLWTEYQSGNDKAGATAKLQAALSALAHKSLDRTRQTAADRAAKIKDILTDDQWKQFDSMGH